MKENEGKEMREDVRRTEKRGKIDLTRSLLQPHDLLVREDASVVNDAHRSLGFTEISRADVGFGDLASFDVDLEGMGADEASEEG